MNECVFIVIQKKREKEWVFFVKYCQHIDIDYNKKYISVFYPRGTKRYLKVTIK
jgi:hypothetical protein